MLSSAVWRASLLIPLVAASCVASAQATLWAKRFEYKGYNDEPRTVQVDSSGNVFVVGGTSSSGTVDGLVVKYAPNGQRLWFRKIGKPDLFETLYDAKVDSGGNIVVAGWVRTPTGYGDLFVQKLDPNGTLLWNRIYADPSGYSDQARSLAIDGADNVVVTGLSGATNETTDTIVLKYSASGKRLWAQRYGTPWILENATKAATDGQGNIYIAGYQQGRDSDYDVFLLKLSPDGAFLWDRRYDGPYGMNDLLYGLTLDALGNPLLLVGSQTWGEHDLTVVKVARNGSLLWSDVFSEAIDEQVYGFAIATDTQRNIVVAGRINGPNGADFLTLKYDPNGALRWRSTYNSPYNLDDIAQDLALDAQGNVYVTGVSYQAADFYHGKDFLTLKYRPTGALRWARRYDDPWQLGDHATSVAVCPDGNVVVSGSSYLPSIDLPPDVDFFTIKYSSGG
ncbi:MAG TPA: SBBP repeat-containing protein [Fimbriimonas sp.]